MRLDMKRIRLLTIMGVCLTGMFGAMLYWGIGRQFSLDHRTFVLIAPNENCKMPSGIRLYVLLEAHPSYEFYFMVVDDYGALQMGSCELSAGNVVLGEELRLPGTSAPKTGTVFKASLRIRSQILDSGLVKAPGVPDGARITISRFNSFSKG
jgi:hypothetical protein